MKGLSLFSSAGVGETYLADCGVDIIVANELVERRANLYRALYPECNMICGDITDVSVFDSIIEASNGIEFMIASPPCQGMSVAGKNRHQDTMVNDKRNYLVNYVFEAIEKLKPRFVLIENVPMLLKFQLPYKGEIYYLDVGQGDAACVLCDGHAMLIDGGDRNKSDLMYSFLKSHSISKLDCVIASHPDADHIGGLAGALNYATTSTAYCTTDEHDTDTLHL